jgi:DNA-directed RNA polymerase subunit RPC12/RpoP
MANERDILWEGKRFWVTRGGSKGRPVTQVMKIGSVVSESVETYSPGADGESIAVDERRLCHSSAGRRMGLMKTAIKTIKSVELTCPHCEQTIPTFGGYSLFWTVEELVQAGNSVECPSCKKRVKLPKVKR